MPKLCLEFRDSRLARIGGKQAILKRADHRFIELIELVSHRGPPFLSAGFNNYANVFVRTRPIPRLSKAGMPSRSEGWGGAEREPDRAKH